MSNKKFNGYAPRNELVSEALHYYGFPNDVDEKDCHIVHDSINAEESPRIVCAIGKSGTLDSKLVKLDSGKEVLKPQTGFRIASYELVERDNGNVIWQPKSWVNADELLAMQKGIESGIFSSLVDRDSKRAEIMAQKVADRKVERMAKAQAKAEANAVARAEALKAGIPFKAKSDKTGRVKALIEESRKKEAEVADLIVKESKTK